MVREENTAQIKAIAAYQQHIYTEGSVFGENKSTAEGSRAVYKGGARAIPLIATR